MIERIINIVSVQKDALKKLTAPSGSNVILPNINSNNLGTSVGSGEAASTAVRNTAALSVLL